MVKKSGFSIIEVIIVIVIIGILTAIVAVSYGGVTKQARDSSRREGIDAIVKALDLYYLDHGVFPRGKCVTGCVINTGWSTTNDDSWKYLEEQLVPEYISALPTDPKPTIGTSPHSANANGYAYFSNTSGIYCGTSVRQMYILVYGFEGNPNKNTLDGVCTVSPLFYSSKSNYRVAVHD